jgi:hypothetical protein
VQTKQTTSIHWFFDLFKALAIFVIAGIDIDVQQLGYVSIQGLELRAEI